MVETRAIRIAELTNADVKMVEETLMQAQAKKNQMGGSRFDTMMIGGNVGGMPKSNYR